MGNFFAIVINEEFLILLTFVVFLALVTKSVSKMVSDELESRTAQIDEQYNFYLRASVSYLNSVIDFYKDTRIESLIHLSKYLEYIITKDIERSQVRLMQLLVSQRIAKVRAIKNTENQVDSEITKSLVEGFKNI